MSFSIPRGVASDKFSISSSGLVTLRSPLDREATSRYSVPIVARSSKFLDLTTLEVVVLDENDNSPLFTSESCYTLAVPENQDSINIHTVAAIDIDEGKNRDIFYSIVGECNKLHCNICIFIKKKIKQYKLDLFKFYKYKKKKIRFVQQVATLTQSSSSIQRLVSCQPRAWTGRTYQSTRLRYRQRTRDAQAWRLAAT